jgi:hypothetical protein
VNVTGITESSIAAAGTRPKRYLPRRNTETTAMLHILIDLGVLLAARGVSASDATPNGSQRRSLRRVASSLRQHLRKGDRHACNIIDYCRYGRFSRHFRRFSRSRDG